MTASIFSTQNLQTFLRRKYLRPPSRGPPGPPPPGPGPRGGPLRSERSPPLRSGRLSPPPACALGAFVSSAILLLLSKFVVSKNFLKNLYADAGASVVASTVAGVTVTGAGC